MLPPYKPHLDYLGFKLIPPGSLFRPYVQAFYHFRRDVPLAETYEEYMHPNGGFGIVFNLGDPVRLDGELVTEPVFLDSTNTVSRKMGFQGRVELMGVNFHSSGAYPFFRLPLHELRDERGLPNGLDRPGLLDLHEQLCETWSVPDRIQLLREWLLGRLALGTERSKLTHASVNILRIRNGQLAIPFLAQKLAVSQRHLERLFHTQVGMSPKQYTRLLRVMTARVALKQLEDETTTSLGARLGYFDQSHFIREFSSVVGLTPYTYMQRGKTRPNLE
jgi:AraC-like DNA-binding protein